MMMVVFVKDINHVDIFVEVFNGHDETEHGLGSSQTTSESGKVRSYAVYK